MKIAHNIKNRIHLIFTLTYGRKYHKIIQNKYLPVK